MIDRIEVQNYRSILGRSVDGTGTPAIVDIEEDITTLIGKNEAGKSNIIRAVSRLQNREPMKKRNLSNYGDYCSESFDEIEILRCRLSLGALDEDVEPAKDVGRSKTVPWLSGPSQPEGVRHFIPHKEIDDLDPLFEDDGLASHGEGESFPLGKALAAGRVEIVHFASGDHAVDIVTERSGDSECSDLLDAFDFPLSIDDFILERYNEHLRLCRWFISNVVVESERYVEVDRLGGLETEEIDSKPDFEAEVERCLEKISEAFDEADPIEYEDIDMEGEVATTQFDTFDIHEAAEDLLSTLSGLKNSQGAIKELPNIVKQSEIQLAETQYDLRDDRQNPIVQGILTLGDIELEDYASLDSDELQDSFDSALETLSKNLNAFWDFNPQKRDTLGTITPGETERYEFACELSDGEINIKLSENDGEYVSLGRRSDGMRWIVTFLLAILAEPYKQSEGRQTVVMLDDPGIHLHPEAEKKLFRAFFHVISQAQVVYTTHSPALIDQRESDRLRIVEHDSESTSGGPTGTTVANEIAKATTDGEQVDPLATARDAVGWTLSDSLFRGKQTVLVEGPSDKRYLNLFNDYLRWNDGVYLGDDPKFVSSGGGEMPFLSRILAAENVTHANLMDDDSTNLDLESEVEQRTIRYNDFLVPDTNEYEAEVEDLFDREFFIRVAAEEHEELDAETILSDPFEVPCGIVDYLENYLDSTREREGKLRKENIAEKIVKRLDNELETSPDEYSETIDRFEAVISELKAYFEENED